MLILYFVMTHILKGKNQLRVVGVALVLTFLISYVFAPKNQKKIWQQNPPEIWSYTLWGLWAGITGIFICISMETLTLNFFKFAQVALLLWTVYGIIRMREKYDVIYIAIILSAVVQISAVFLGYRYDKNTEDLMTDVSVSDQLRATGLTSNANSLAQLMVLAVSCALMFWRSQESFFVASIKKGCIIIFACVAFYIVLQSGSRKATLYSALFIVGWLVWLFPKGTGASALFLRVGSVVLILAISGAVLTFVMDDTIVGKRFAQLMESGGGSVVSGSQEDIRFEMYRDGFRMFLEHPIAGVGLGHFMLYFWLPMYSHSDYMEPLACTGLVGFLIYHSFYWIIIYRIVKLRSKSRDTNMRYKLGLMMLTLSIVLLWGVGTPHWPDAIILSLLLTYGTYAWVLDKKAFTVLPNRRSEIISR